MDYTFEWRDENHDLHRMSVLTSDESFAWYKALNACGWEQRTSLGLIGDCRSRQIRNGIIKNWWNAMDDRNLYNFNTLYLSSNLSDRIKSGFVKVVNV